MGLGLSYSQDFVQFQEFLSIWVRLPLTSSVVGISVSTNNNEQILPLAEVRSEAS